MEPDNFLPAYHAVEEVRSTRKPIEELRNRPPHISFPTWFWMHVNKTETCWEWTRATTRDGYGKVRYGAAGSVATHRVAWELTHGLIPDGMWVLHHCDNRLCARPDHLYLGDANDNMADMVKRERAKRGEENGNNVLTEEQAKQIKQLREEGMLYREIAAHLQVPMRLVTDVASGRTWKWL